MNEEELISIIDVAKKLNMHKATLFKVINKLGISTTKQKNSDHRGQSISYIRKADLDRIINSLSTGHERKHESIGSSFAQLDHGMFYLIQLEPKLDPGRFKVGFASNMPERLRSHRCSAPLAVIVNTWPCKELWEKTAIDSVTQGCERIHTEVFRIPDISIVKQKCDQFFSVMPSLEDIKKK